MIKANYLIVSVSQSKTLVKINIAHNIIISFVRAPYISSATLIGTDDWYLIGTDCVRATQWLEPGLICFSSDTLHS